MASASEKLKSRSPETFNNVLGPRPQEFTHADNIVRRYLWEAEPIFKALDDLREQGWKSIEGDKFFQQLRERSDAANDEDGTAFFYEMNKSIGRELDQAGAFETNSDTSIRALNLCMAPGGYTFSLLRAIPSAHISGITLPSEDGGHPMLLPFGESDLRVEVKFMDITMLAVEFGINLTQVPATHPEAAKFNSDTPYQGLLYDIVLCDGQVLRTHKGQNFRKDLESFRLMVSQLIFGMKRIKAGGTFIILLHKPDAWSTVKVLHTFDRFSKIKLFKPNKVHARRSSFYLIAKDVQPGQVEAINAIEDWKKDWWVANFGGEDGTGTLQVDDEALVNSVLECFGPKLVKLGKKPWRIQRDALSKAPFIK